MYIYIHCTEEIWSTIAASTTQFISELTPLLRTNVNTINVPYAWYAAIMDNV